MPAPASPARRGAGAATYLEYRYMPLHVRTFLDTLSAQFKAQLDVDEVY